MFRRQCTGKGDAFFDGRSHRAPHTGGNGLHSVHDDGKLVRSDGLRPIAQGMGRIVVDLDDQAVRPGGHGRHGHAFHHPGLAAGVGGVHHHRQVAQPLHCQDRREVQGVAGIGLKGTDAPLTQNDVWIALAHNILRAHEPLLNGGGQPPFQEDGLFGSAHLFQQVEVLHVTGADLDDVHRLLEHGKLVGTHQLSDDGHAGGVLGVQQQTNALHSFALKRVGRGAGLVGAPPHGAGSGGLYRLGHPHHLALALYRAGTGDHYQFVSADGHAAAHIDYRVVRVVFAVGLFVGFGHTHNPVHPVQLGQVLLIQPAGVPFGAENGDL